MATQDSNQRCGTCGGAGEVMVDTTVKVTGLNPDGETMWTKTETSRRSVNCTACGG